MDPPILCTSTKTTPRFPLGLNGRFHGLLADRNAGNVDLFNDRYGLHRIYYHESKEAFYFAAEAKAILAVRPELRTADRQSLGEFVSCGCVRWRTAHSSKVSMYFRRLRPGSFGTDHCSRRGRTFSRRNGKIKRPWSRKPITKHFVRPFRETSRGTSLAENGSGCP